MLRITTPCCIYPIVITRRHLDLKEVAALFKRLAPDRSTRSAYNAAVEALLLTDSNIDRKLDRTEFQELLNRQADDSLLASCTFGS